jgi:hypothetical protein
MFTAMMIRMAVDNNNRQRMGQQARLEAQNYAIDRTSRMMLERYERVVRDSAGRKQTLRVRVDRFIELFRK